MVEHEVNERDAEPMGDHHLGQLLRNDLWLTLAATGLLGLATVVVTTTTITYLPTGTPRAAALEGATVALALAGLLSVLSATRHHRHRGELAAMSTSLTQSRIELAERERSLRNLTARQSMILRMERELSGNSDPVAAATVAARAARAVSGADRVSVWMIDDERASVRLVSDTASGDTDQADLQWAPLDQGTIGAAIAERQPVTGEDPDGTRQWVWPLIAANRVTGAMAVTEGPVDIDDAIADAVATLAIHASAAIEAARLHAENMVLARRDPLTHLPNRRSFDEDLEQERERSRRHTSPVSLVMIDLDHFKEINDTHGHPFGDDVLRRVAAAILETLRKSDSAYRVGGEEFAVIARETEIDGVCLLAERLRVKIESTLSVERGDPVSLTASFGVAELGHKTPDIGTLVAAADAALYAAKRNGRNRVELRGELRDEILAETVVVIDQQQSA